MDNELYLRSFTDALEILSVRCLAEAQYKLCGATNGCFAKYHTDMIHRPLSPLLRFPFSFFHFFFWFCF